MHQTLPFYMGSTQCSHQEGLNIALEQHYYSLQASIDFFTMLDDGKFFTKLVLDNGHLQA